MLTSRNVAVAAAVLEVLLLGWFAGWIRWSPNHDVVSLAAFVAALAALLFAFVTFGGMYLWGILRRGAEERRARSRPTGHIYRTTATVVPVVRRRATPALDDEDTAMIEEAPAPVTPRWGTAT